MKHDEAIWHSSGVCRVRVCVSFKIPNQSSISCCSICLSALK